MSWSLFTEKQWEYLYKLYLRGYSARALAEWTYVTPATIRCGFLVRGFETNRCARPLSDFTEEFKSLAPKQGTQAVVKLDRDTREIIATYDTAVIAARENGIAHQHIYACCAGRESTAGGYAWARVSEVDDDRV